MVHISVLFLVLILVCLWFLFWTLSWFWIWPTTPSWPWFWSWYWFWFWYLFWPCSCPWSWVWFPICPPLASAASICLSHTPFLSPSSCSTHPSQCHSYVRNGGTVFPGRDFIMMRLCLCESDAQALCEEKKEKYVSVWCVHYVFVWVRVCSSGATVVQTDVLQ